MQSPLSTGSPTAGCLVRWLFRQHSIEPGLREPELSTLTGEFDPPHIDRMSQAQGEIHWSGITAIEEYSIHCPEHRTSFTLAPLAWNTAKMLRAASSGINSGGI